MEKKCRYCAMMIPKEAKICPHCRKKFGWTTPAKIAVVLLGLAIFGSFLGENAKDTPKSKPASPQTIPTAVRLPAIPTTAPMPARTPPAPSEPGLVLLESNWEGTEHGSRYISGTIKNDSNKPCRYAQISFSLYDADNAQVGSAMTNINNLEPNGTWKFRALVFEKRALSYKFANISSW